MALQLVITNAGRAAVIDQANGGFRAVRIAAVGVSPTAINAAPASTNLPDEVKRIATIAGEATATDVTHLTVTDESADSYIVRSFALYLSDGTLFALYGQADPIVQKSAQALLLLAIDVALSNIPAAAITFGNANFINPAATTERAGVVELATEAEASALADAARALTPKAMAAIFTAANVLSRLIAVDGAGSGLDADLLDGQQGTDFISARGVIAPSQLDQAKTPGFYSVEYGSFSDSLLVWRTVSSTGPVQISANHTGRFEWRNCVDNFAWSGWRSIWHSANDGAGSGLDADLLDGQQGSWYADVTARLGYSPLPSASYTAADVMGKTLTVDGAGSGLDADLLDGQQGTDFISVRGVIVPSQLDDAKTSGLYSVEYGSFSDSMLVWKTSSSTGPVQIAANFNGRLAWRNCVDNASWSAWRSLWHTHNDGAGSGLDADLLDGQQGSWYADVISRLGFNPLPASTYTAADVLAKTLTLDGAGSGLDADLLDGQQGSWYADVISRLGYSPLPVSTYTAADVLAKAVTVDGAGSGLDADLVDGWHRDDIRDWGNLLNKPAVFPVAAHTHGAADIAGAFSGTLSGNGYTVLPNGLILQWVTGAQQAASSEGTQYVAFPIAFNTCFQVITSTQVANPNIESHAIYQLISFAAEGATVMRQLVSASGADREPSWPRLFAIGR